MALYRLGTDLVMYFDSPGNERPMLSRFLWWPGDQGTYPCTDGCVLLMLPPKIYIAITEAVNVSANGHVRGVIQSVTSKELQ